VSSGGWSDRGPARPARRRADPRRSAGQGRCPRRTCLPARTPERTPSPRSAPNGHRPLRRRRLLLSPTVIHQAITSRSLMAGPASLAVTRRPPGQARNRPPARSTAVSSRPAGRRWGPQRPLWSGAVRGGGPPALEGAGGPARWQEVATKGARGPGRQDRAVTAAGRSARPPARWSRRRRNTTDRTAGRRCPPRPPH